MKARGVGRSIGSICALGVTVLFAALLPAGAGAAGVIPSLQISYTGSMKIEGYNRESGSWTREMSWTAGSLYNGETLEGGETLTFSSLTGSYEDQRYNAQCPKNVKVTNITRTHALLRSEENPLALRWLDEAIPPETYEVMAVPLGLPDWWEGKEFIGTPCELPEYETPLEHGLRNWNFISFCTPSSPTEQAEYDEMIEKPVVFKAGVPSSVTKTLSESCYENGFQYESTLTSTVTATSPAANNEKPPSTPSPPPPSTPPATPPQPPTRQQAEAERQRMKEEGKADLGKAIQAAAAHLGVQTLVDLAADKLLSDVADEVGGPSARFQGTSEVTRLVNDYRILKDPPDADFAEFAQPSPVRADVAAATCPRGHGRKAVYCKKLASAEKTLSAACSQTAATTAALETTISRDTAALQASQLAAAGEQAAHFQALEAQLQAALAAEGRAGAAVVALLRQAGVPGRLDKQQTKRVLAAVEQRAAEEGVSKSSLASAVGTAALAPRPLDVFALLGEAGG